MAKLIGYRIKQMEFEDDKGKDVKLDRVSLFALAKTLSTVEGGMIPTEYKVEIKDLEFVFNERMDSHPNIQAFLSKKLDRECFLETVPDGKRVKLVRVTFLDDLMNTSKKGG